MSETTTGVPPIGTVIKVDEGDGITTVHTVDSTTTTADMEGVQVDAVLNGYGVTLIPAPKNPLGAAVGEGQFDLGRIEEQTADRELFNRMALDLLGSGLADSYPGSLKSRESQAAEFAAAQAAAQSAALRKNAQEYDDAVYNLTRDYNLARIERLEAKAAFERQADSQANAYQQQRVQVQIQSIDRQVAESDRQFQLQLEGLANQRSDFERSNSTSADPFRALGAGAVGANSPLAAYAKRVMDLGIASDEEKLRINEKVAAEQEAARQGALAAQRQQSIIDEQELINRENNASLAWIRGYGSDAVEDARQGMSLDEIARTHSLRERKIRTGTDVATGAAQMEYPSEMGTVSDSSTTGSVLDDAVNGTVAASKKVGGYENPIIVKGGYVPPAPPGANVFDGLIGTPTETPVRNQGSGVF